MTTVGAELARLFPKGTSRAKPGTSWESIPLLPTDVFAAAGHLLEASGAYQYVVAPFPGTGPFGYDRPTFAPTQTELNSWCSLGRRWSIDTDARVDAEPFWKVLWNSRGEPLVQTPATSNPVPGWWIAAHALLVISDEASGDFGYPLSTSPPIPWANAFALRLLQARTRSKIIPNPFDPSDDRHRSRHVALDSLSPQSDRHVVRVLPKGRTTETGCVMRAFSHNLTLLPPHGHPNAYWHKAASISALSSTELRLLLIPFPYILPDHSFQGEENTATTPGRRWGRFRINQRWLTPDPASVASTPSSRASFVGFVDALLRQAAATAGQAAHGILFPEYALDWDTYDALVRHVLNHWPNIEFVVSGVSRDCNGREGNQVTLTIFKATSSTSRLAETHSRRKHHRWQIDGSQIDAYGIGADLDPDVVWWEHQVVEERVLHTDVLRGGSTLTAVICEDLARVDPGLALLRSLGPNLVFALLMDGPQLRTRWPGIYATGLADDPGSSILSFTSLALVDKSNAVRASRGKRAGGRAIGLWKNRPRPGAASPNDFAELAIRDGHQALTVLLKGEAASETTIDGRSNSDTTAWYLEEHTSVGLTPSVISAGGWDWVVKGPTSP